MASAALASKYSHLVIDKNGKRVRLDGKTVNFSYYESLYSPFITANMIYIDTGGSTTDNRSDKPGTIREALPLTGKEKIEVIIETKRGNLLLKTNPLGVNGNHTPSQESNREAVFLPLMSNYAYVNTETPVSRKFTGRISDSVTKILKEYLKVPENRIKIDPTSNSYNFTGLPQKGPLDNIISLCKKSIPVSGDPGYFFYETQDGFNYRSIDSLISQDPKATYTYSNVLKSNLDNDDNDFKIVETPITIKDQNVLDDSKGGSSYSLNIFFDPRTFKYDEVVFDLKENKIKKSLGELPPHLRNSKSVRKFFHILDVGSLDPNISINVNNDPREWQAKSCARYNTLHSQIVQIQVPCNPELRAGDTIICNIERTSQDDKVSNPFDRRKYLILNLCHHFSTTRSYTSLTIIRDGYGIYTNKK